MRLGHLILAVALGLNVTLVTGCETDDTGTSGNASAEMPGEPAPPAADGAAAHFSVLRDPATEDDRMTPDVRAQLEGPVEEQGGDLDRARALRMSATEAQTWVIPGEKVVCLATPTPTGFGINCATVASALKGGLSGQLIKSEGPDSEQIVVALLPDGVKTVEVLPTKGQPRNVAVRENVIAVEARVGDEVSYRDASGRHILAGP